MTIRENTRIKKNSTATVVDWRADCMRACSGIVEMVPKFKGPSEAPVQIDKSFFSGRRKYNRGRILVGDAFESRLELQKEEFEVNRWGLDEEDADNEMDFGHDEKNWRWALDIYLSVRHIKYIRDSNIKVETIKSDREVCERGQCNAD